MFIKRGDVKIVSILDDEEMTDEERDTLSDLTKKAKKSIKQSDSKSDLPQTVKRSGS